MLGSIRSLKNSSVVVFLLMVFVSGQVSLLQADEYITCESKNDRRSYCNVSGIRDSNIELDRKLSKSPCIAEQTWGTDSRGIWVDGGCRAEFRVTRRYSSHGGSWGGHKHKDLEYEREKLELEQERLEFEKEKAKHEAATAQAPDVCPKGFRPGRCEKRERKKGCKDMRTERGLGCRTN